MALLVSDEEIAAIREAHATGEVTRAAVETLLRKIELLTVAVAAGIEAQNQTIGYHEKVRQ